MSRIVDTLRFFLLQHAAGMPVRDLDTLLSPSQCLRERRVTSRHQGRALWSRRTDRRTAVTLAARIMGEAVGGEVLVADVVRQLVAGKGFTFEDLGLRRLKGFDESVRLWAVPTGRDNSTPSR